MAFDRYCSSDHRSNSSMVQLSLGSPRGGNLQAAAAAAAPEEDDDEVVVENDSSILIINIIMFGKVRYYVSRR